MSREAMQLALEALVFAQYEDEDYDDACDQKVRAARDALRQALEEKHEPVAWASSLDFDDDDQEIIPAKDKGKLGTGNCDIPLYIAPPKKEWVGLTEDECIKSLPRMPYEYEFNVQALLEYTKIVESKLKEKNT